MTIKPVSTHLLAILILLLFVPKAYAQTPQFTLPKTSLGPEDIAIIINDVDPLSRQIGKYYQTRRNIPPQNLIHVRFRTGTSIMNLSEFTRIKSQVDRRTPASVQAFVLTWSAPYRVECMSITSAFAFGFDKAYCSINCGTTKRSPYYNSPSSTPFTDYHIRPAMALAGTNFKAVKDLIDRGIDADGSHPIGTGYFMNTSDPTRNVRALTYSSTIQAAKNLVDIQALKQDYLQNVQNVLFYFTGIALVSHLETVKFRPGAIADHLTSFGGQLTDSTQMSSLRWLEAGATGSYGTVEEPCNHLAKFPSPALVIYWYLSGNSLIEAYWKSVESPGEGIFIGEPLSKPYGGYSVQTINNQTVLRTQALVPGTYELYETNHSTHPVQPAVTSVPIHFGMNELHFSNLNKPAYQLIWVH